jgi:hypothetical protein
MRLDFIVRVRVVESNLNEMFGSLSGCIEQVLDEKKKSGIIRALGFDMFLG